MTIKVVGKNVEWDCGDGCCSETTLELEITYPDGKIDDHEFLGVHARNVQHLQTLVENNRGIELVGDVEYILTS